MVTPDLVLPPLHPQNFDCVSSALASSSLFLCNATFSGAITCRYQKLPYTIIQAFFTTKSNFVTYLNVTIALRVMDNT
jgi:hypothetical protein